MCGGTHSAFNTACGVLGLSPRVPGEPHWGPRPASRLGGLSPRVRGNLSCSGRGRARRGSIPACAGEPIFSTASSTASSVYPRVCGGTSGQNRPLELPGGLSPRVRGNRRRGEGHADGDGSIPACAGEPRYGRPVGGVTAGLSPRVRGNPCHCPAHEVTPGSIPACAGEPARLFPNFPNSQGSIPACAGEPRGGREAAGEDQVYPRVCGGTYAFPRRIAGGYGLSPRVRGNLAGFPRLHPPDGSIPACAGEPSSASCVSARRRVYPRVCGGTADMTD